MYVCGITVYDYMHVGNARFMVVFDMVRRWLRASGYRVTYVRNITDIDDKIIRRAAEDGEPVEAVTARFIQAMDEDAAALRVLIETRTWPPPDSRDHPSPRLAEVPTIGQKHEIGRRLAISRNQVWSKSGHPE